MPDTGAVVVAVAQLALTVGELDANREAARAEAAVAGARLVVLPELSDSGYVFSSADEARSPAPPGERSGEVVSAQAAARSNGVFIAVADRCKTERGVDWVGGSVIVQHGGYPAAGPVSADRAAVLTATIDLRLARDKRVSELNDRFTDRRPDLYTRLWDAAQPTGQRPAEALGIDPLRTAARSRPPA